MRSKIGLTSTESIVDRIPDREERLDLSGGRFLLVNIQKALVCPLKSIIVASVAKGISTS